VGERICPRTGKTQYDRLGAQMALLRIKSNKQRAKRRKVEQRSYVCDCGYYHLTSQTNSKLPPGKASRRREI
jgi:hypothetical protein